MIVICWHHQFDLTCHIFQWTIPTRTGSDIQLALFFTGSTFHLFGNFGKYCKSNLCFFLIWVNIGLGKMFIMNLVLQVLRVSWNIIGDSSSGVAPIFLITILNDYHSHHFKWSPLQCTVIIITSCRDHHHHHILEWLIVVLRNILNSA